METVVAVVLVPVMGIAAGVLTTVAGLGGGMLLVLALSLLMDPAAALAATAPALLVGNLHRVLLFRRKVRWEVGRRFVLGALPGSVAGGLVVSLLPEGLLRVLMATLLGMALLFGLGVLKLRAGPGALVPGGFGIGALAAAGGGAGLLTAPLLMGVGLSGEAYVSTAALSAFTMHLGRILAYGAGGLLTGEVLRLATLLTVAILVGNTLGRRLRGVLHHRVATRLETGTLVVSAGLALAGLAR